MRSFFSPFSLEVGQYRECEAFTVNATVFMQGYRKVFLLTINSLDLAQRIGWLGQRNIKFSTVLRNKKPMLALEPSDNRADGVLIQGKSYLSIRSTDAPFLPKEMHKQKALVAYLDEIASEKMVTIALPQDYCIVNDNNENFEESDQPEISSWPAVYDDYLMHVKHNTVRRGVR